MIGWQLAGSLAGVLGLAAVAWWMGLGRSEPLTEEEVRERAEFELMPFVVRDVFLGRDGRAALVVGEDRRWLALKAHGTQPASRLLVAPEWREEGDVLVLATGDRMFGDLRLALGAEDRDRLRKLL